MGMDLIPRRKDAESIHYNWSGWRALIDFLEARGVDTSEFDGSNDGQLICAATCRKVAKAIYNSPEAYNSLYGGTPKPDGGYGNDPATEHTKAWQNSSGVRQF